MDDEQIFDATWECTHLFESCRTSAIWGYDNLARLDKCKDKFGVWTYDLRANKTGHYSLDYRLWNRPDIRDDILNLVRRIIKSLDLLIRNDFPHNTSGTGGGQGKDDSDRRIPELPPWVIHYVGFEVSSSQAKEPHIPSSPIPRHLYYIQTDINILNVLSIVIRRTGTKLRYEHADRALLSAPTSYDNLRLHLAHLILVKPYTTLLRSLDLAVLHNRVPPVVALLIRKWVHDDSRAHRQLNDLTQSVVVRRNRIQFAQEPWSPAGTPPQPNNSQPTIRSTAYPLSPHLDDNSGQLWRSPSSAPITASRPESAISSSFILPPVDITKRPVEAITEITWAGLQEDYPPRPSTAKGARTFLCPYCSHNVPVRYIKNEAQWRNHINHDILPYTCIFPACATSTEFYLTRADWIQHMTHTHGYLCWICDVCPLQPGGICLNFPSVDSWANHERQVHNWPLTDKDASMLAKMAEWKRLGRARCPLCPRSKGLYSLEEDEHIALHLHSFALESLQGDISQEMHSLNLDHDSVV